VAFLPVGLAFLRRRAVSGRSCDVAVFDLFVAAVTVLTAAPAAGVLVAARRAATVLAVAGGLLATGLLAGGGDYLGGFARTTLARVPGSATPLTVLDDSWQWAGLLVVLAACAIIISAATRQPAAQTWLLAVLSAAAVAGPLNQARLHTAAVLDKHVGLGAWFAAMPPGTRSTGSSRLRPPPGPGP
jgi:hypothetical protein